MPRQPFNADERAKEREATPTTVGGTEFFPVRLSNKVMREVRKIGRASEPTTKAAEIKERERDAAQLALAKANGKPEPDPAEIARLQAELDERAAALEEAADAQQDASSAALFGQLALLLRDGEGTPPDPDFLEEHLDTREAGPLMDWLMTDGEGGNSSTSESTPTTPTATST